MALSYSDFRSILTTLGDPLPQKDALEFIHIVDEDQDGMLHIDELMKVRTRYSVRTDLQKASSCFSVACRIVTCTFHLYAGGIQ